jgi:hypothetical protein
MGIATLGALTRLKDELDSLRLLEMTRKARI